MDSRSMEENIRRAHKCFFQYGSLGAFQDGLSPLSTRSIIETCLIPILLSGSENWIVSGGILEQLESFLGELAKRALKCHLLRVLQHEIGLDQSPCRCSGPASDTSFSYHSEYFYMYTVRPLVGLYQ